MNNDDVIDLLQQVIDELTARRQELQDLQANPGGPFSERTDRLARLAERIGSLNVRLMNLLHRISERQLAARLGGAIPDLPAARVTALRTALRLVSQSIAAANNFKGAIKLASDISEAASQAHAAAKA